MVSYDNEVDILVDFVKKLSPRKTLEIGCNTGKEMEYIKDLTKVYGVDRNIECTKNSKNITCSEGNNTPYKDNSFNLVYSDSVLSHNKEPDSIIDEMIRVSKKYILLIEWIGSRTGTGYTNCKEGLSWIHDYEFLVSGKEIKILFNRKIPCRADLFHVLLLQKDKTKTRIVERVEVKEKESKFIIKLGKFRLRIG